MRWQKSTARPATEAQRRILARAAKHTLGKLICPQDCDVRIWMIHINKMAAKGYICRENRIAYITDIGRAVLANPAMRRRSGSRSFWARAGQSFEVPA